MMLVLSRVVAQVLVFKIKMGHKMLWNDFYNDTTKGLDLQGQSLKLSPELEILSFCIVAQNRSPPSQ